MLDETLQRELGARPLHELKQCFPYFVDINDVQQGLASDYVDLDPATHTATAVLNYIKQRHQQQAEEDRGPDIAKVDGMNCPAESDQSLGLEVLKRYLGDDGIEDFLAELFDSDGNSQSGPGFHQDCEFMLRCFAKMKKSLLWVRAEHVRIKLYLERLDEHSREDHVVITGERGIGKSRLLYYLAICRIRQGRPVLLHIPSQPKTFFFDGTHAYFMDTEAFETRSAPALLDIEAAKYANGLWILLDAHRDNLRTRVPSWSWQIPGARVIYSCLPDYMRWEKARSGGFKSRVVVMDPYSLAEARLLAILELEISPVRGRSHLPASQERKQQLFEMSQKFFNYSQGHRTFIEDAWTEDAQQRLKDLHRESSIMIMELTPEKLSALLAPMLLRATFSEDAHRVFCMTRAREDREYYMNSTYKVDFELRLLNSRVGQAIMDQLANKTKEVRRKYYRTVLDDPIAGQIAGHMLGDRLASFWMEQGNMELNLHESTKPLNRSLLFARTPKSTPVSIEVKRQEVRYGLPKQLESNVLYHPYNQALAGVDMIIREANQYYGVQVLMAAKHQISPRLDVVLTKAGISLSNYTHVLVMDNLDSGKSVVEDTLKVSLPSENWDQGESFIGKCRAAWMEPPTGVFERAED